MYGLWLEGRFVGVAAGAVGGPRVGLAALLATFGTCISVAITGDSATATMDAQNEALGSRTVSLPLKLEDGWKICKT